MSAKKYFFKISHDKTMKIKERQLQQFIRNSSLSHIICDNVFDFSIDIPESLSIEFNTTTINFIKFMISYPNKPLLTYIKLDPRTCKYYFQLGLLFGVNVLIDHVINELKIESDKKYSCACWIMYFMLASGLGNHYALNNLIKCMPNKTAILKEINSTDCSISSIWKENKYMEFVTVLSKNEMSKSILYEKDNHIIRELLKNKIKLSDYEKKSVLFIGLIIIDNKCFIIFKNSSNIAEDYKNLHSKLKQKKIFTIDVILTKDGDKIINDYERRIKLYHSDLIHNLFLHSVRPYLLIELSNNALKYLTTTSNFIRDIKTC